MGLLRIFDAPEKCSLWIQANERCFQLWIYGRCRSCLEEMRKRWMAPFIQRQNEKKDENIFETKRDEIVRSWRQEQIQ